MSDEDLYSLVAFLDTLEPVKNPVPRSQIAFPVSLVMKSALQPTGQVAEPVVDSHVVWQAGDQQQKPRG